jgi:dual specificity phosphatase 12
MGSPNIPTTYYVIFYFYLLQVTDLPQEDLLSHFTGSNAFIQEGLAKDGAVLVHCYRGRSRSATVVVAFLMQKHGYSAERALAKVRSKREIIQPHDSFLAQLRLYESMEFSIDPENLQFKMFK